jgi:hypothetical protein
MIGFVPGSLAQLKGWLVNWLLQDIEIEKAVIIDGRIVNAKFGRYTISLTSNLIRWNTTQSAAAAGDIGMDSVSGRPSVFIGGVSRDVLGSHEVIRPGGQVTFTANQQMGGFKLTGLADGSASTDSVTYGQAAAFAVNLDSKASVRLATTAALAANTAAGSGVGKTLTADANGALSIDSVATANGNRVLIKNETPASDNGIYTVTDTGSAGTPYVLTRATDADQDAEVTTNLLVGVDAGTVNGATTWRLTTAATIVVDTTSLTFSLFEATFDHNSLLNLAVGDTHTQYALGVGRSGGQSVYGGTGAGDDFNIYSTSNATKGSIFIGFQSTIGISVDESTNRVGIGVSSPSVKFDLRAVNSGQQFTMGASASVGDFVPFTTNNGMIGTSSLKWNEVNATTVNVGDIGMHRVMPDGQEASWLIQEFPDHLEAKNRITGKRYRIPLEEIV